jgi:hypothetical protein
MLRMLLFTVLISCAKTTSPPEEPCCSLPGPSTPSIGDEIVAGTADGSPAEKTPWPQDHLRGVHGWLAIGGVLLGGRDEAMILGEGSLSELPPPLELAGQSLHAVRAEGTESVSVGTPTQIIDCGGSAHTVLPITGVSESSLEWIVSPTFKDAEEYPITVTDSLNRQEWSFGSDVAGWSTLDDGQTQWFWTSSETHSSSGTALLPAVPEAIKAWRIGGERVLAVVWMHDSSTHVELIVWSDEEPARISAATISRCVD